MTIAENHPSAVSGSFTAAPRLVVAIRLTLYLFHRPLRHDNVPGELTSPVMPPDMCSIDPAATIFNFVRCPD
jgi:hypothetical protein